MKYYIIKTVYVGPNPDQHLNEDIFEITTTPGRTNLGNQKVVNGWLGQCGDWNYTACGEFATLEEARIALNELTDGNYRETSVDRSEEGVVFKALIGLYEELDRETSEAFTYDELYRHLSAETTDEEIDKMLSEAEASYNAEGKSLDIAHLRQWFQECRDELKTE